MIETDSPFNITKNKIKNKLIYIYIKQSYYI